MTLSINTAAIALDRGRFVLDANTAVESWAVGGALSTAKAAENESGSAVSVGVSGALNLVDLNSLATIGAAQALFDPAVAAPAAATNIGITSGAVGINALTTGSINAISVAGTLDAAENNPGLISKLSNAYATVSNLKGNFSRSIADRLANAKSNGIGKYSSSNAYNNAQSNAASSRGASAASAPPAAAKQTVTNGWGIAGSASVNLSELASKVDIASARFTRAGIEPATFVAKAIEAVDMLAVTGGAAIAKGNKFDGKSTLVGGAFGLSASKNVTTAALTGTAISGFDGVDVAAAANGLRIGAGQALAVDVTKTDSGAVAAASASVVIARDAARATVDDGSITGKGSGAVNLLAYDGLTIGAGAGGLSYGAQDAAGAGMTLVYVVSPSDGAAFARLGSTPVSGFADLSVRALNAASITSVAAAGAVSARGDTANNALAISLSVNDIVLGAKALIDVGDAGIGAINIGGRLTVAAGDSDGEAIGQAGRSANTAGAAHNANYALGSDAFSADDRISASDIGSGARIISVAVPVSAARGKAVGVGFSANAIDNARTAAITGGGSGNATTIRAGSVSVTTRDTATILSIATGIGASNEATGILGSLSLNEISGASSALIGRSAAADRNIAIDVGTPASPGPITISSAADGGIFSLAGSVSYGKDSAAGVAVSGNRIARADAGAAPGAAAKPGDAGLFAALDGINFAGNPDIALTAVNSSDIKSVAFAGGLSREGTAITGAASLNEIAPAIVARASRIDFLTASPANLRISSSDTASILSIALGTSVALDGKAASVAVSTNLVDSGVVATLDAGSIGSRVTLPGTAGALSLADLGLADNGDFGGVTITGLPAGGRLLLAAADPGAAPTELGAGDKVSQQAIAAGRLRYEPASGPATTPESFAFSTVSRIAVNELAIAASAKAKTLGAGVGAGGAGDSFGGAGSVVVNRSGVTADALLALNDAKITTTGSLAVLATRDSSIDVGAGVLAGSLAGSAVGASVVVNDVTGGASARIAGAGTSGIAAGGAGSGVSGVRTGGLLANLKQFYSLDLVRNADLAATFDLETRTVKDVVVNAGSTHATRTIAVNGAFAEGIGVAATAVVSNVGGRTEASISNVDVVAVSNSAGSQPDIDVRASTQTQGSSFAGAVTGGSNALAAPVISDGFTARTLSSISGGSIDTTGSVNVRAAANQSATALAASAAIVSGLGSALAGLSPRFQSETRASITTPAGLVADNGVAVTADSEARALATFGALAGAGSGGGAAAAAVVVATNENVTSAVYEGRNDVLVGARSFAVDAAGSFDAKVYGGAAALGGAGGLVGNGVGIVHRGTVLARAAGLSFNAPGNDVSVTAREKAVFNPVVGQLGLSANGLAASLGAIVVLSQGKVDAELVNPLISAKNVTVAANGVNAVDAIQAGLAGSALGGAFGANVTYIGVGAVLDTGVLFAGNDGAPASDDDKKVAAAAGSRGAGEGSGNKNLAMIASGANADNAVAPAGLSSAQKARVLDGAASSRAAFTSVNTPDDAATARTCAQILGSGVVLADTLRLDSAANLVSKSSNFQGRLARTPDRRPWPSRVMPPTASPASATGSKPSTVRSRWRQPRDRTRPGSAAMPARRPKRWWRAARSGEWSSGWRWLT